MTKIDVDTLTIQEAHKGLTSGAFTVLELVGAYRKRIDALNGDLNAYLEVYSDIDEQSKRAQEMIDKGEGTVLTGIPFAVKDNILIKGKTASSASKMLENYTATYTATAMQKLIDEGVVFLGRTNMDEFAMGGSTENSAYGVTKNPRNPEHVSGGSSGGSAATVAGGMALAAIGSDTGGSIRQPAAFCGCFGFKPTYGAVSRHGLMAMGSSFDQIGPLARCVDDIEIVFNAIRGQDSLDSTSINEETYPQKEIGNRIGIPWSILEKGGIDGEIKEQFKKTAKVLEKNGVEVVDVELPSLDDALATYYVLIPAEISANMARFDGVRYGFHADGKDLLDDYLKTRGKGLGDEVKRRIMIGTYVLSAGYHDAYYTNAQIVRSNVRKQFAKLFTEVDAVMIPTTPNPAFKIGEKFSDPLSMYLEDIFTVIANIAGIPAMSIPTGTMSNGLPIGTQLLGAHGQEKTLFTLAKKLS